MRKLKEKTRIDAEEDKTTKKVVVPDTSVIIQGIISKELKNKKLEFERILIHEAVMAELESQANKGRESGFLGLDEIKKIRELSRNKKFKIEFLGNRPGDFEIKFAKAGEIDSLIRELAEKHDATLLTADLVQGKVFLAKGLSVKLYNVHKKQNEELLIENFFTKNTASVHLKEDCFPITKIGKPGKWLNNQKKKKITREELEVISKELIEHAKINENSFFDSEKKKGLLLKIKDMKILITKTPVSDSFEIIAIRPIKKLKFEDYKLKNSLKNYLLKKAQGIIIAGTPEGGKTTFAHAIINKQASLKKIIKTFENSRNLSLNGNVSRHGASQISFAEFKDATFLTNPDLVFFDEIRSQEELKLLAEIKNSGINALGVMKSSDPKRAIQKIVTQLGIGSAQTSFDTLIFVSSGEIKKVLCSSLKIKTPESMKEGTKKPIIIFKDFFTNKIEYEAYNIDGETFVF